MVCMSGHQSKDNWCETEIVKKILVEVSLRDGSLKSKGFSKESFQLFLHLKNSWEET